MPGQTARRSRPAGVFEHAQDPIIVGQAAYNGVLTAIRRSDLDPPLGPRPIFTQRLELRDVHGNFRHDVLPRMQKAIHDEMGATFDEYGRMKASLGVSMPNPDAERGELHHAGLRRPGHRGHQALEHRDVRSATLADGTQIWRINHNGVDTHPIHFHLFHVQVINRVGWDGAIRLPDASELGWKDTVRISPLEDTYRRPQADRAVAATLPFEGAQQLPAAEPGACRPARPLGFTNIDPTGTRSAASRTRSYNFGWEYVWHCHILSHEENDMMRAVVFTATPEAPTGPGFHRA